LSYKKNCIYCWILLRPSGKKSEPAKLSEIIVAHRAITRKGRKIKHIGPRRKAKGDFEKHPGKRLREGGGSFQKLDEQIIGVLYGDGMAMTLPDIVTALDLPKREYRHVEGRLKDLCHRKLLRCAARGQYSLKRSDDFVEGTVAVNPRGFGFVTINNPPDWREGNKDVFIPANALATATHGDQVLLRITGRKYDRYEGAVIRVIRRGTNRIVGLFVAGRSTSMVLPESDKFPFSVVVSKEHSRGARNGEAVVVEITEHFLGQRNPSGRIIEILGDPGDMNVQNEITIRNFDLPHRFSQEALAEAAALDAEITLKPGQLDLRNILHVTIDGEDARDFDDAVAIERLADGYRLYVSIADVSHYVRPGSTLDKEAYERGTSVYFPTRVIPMLPERLSNNLCSLVPNEDRLAFTAILDFDDQGNRIAKKFGRSIILSRHRLTYTLVWKMLSGEEPGLRKKYQDIWQSLEIMAELASILETKRYVRGSIGFEIPEARIDLDKDNRITNIGRRERNQAHKLIEEFMLAANEAVASTFTETGQPSLYRVHEAPDPLQVEEFADFARTMGLRLPEGQGSPHWFGKVLKLVAGKPQEYIVNNLLLRAMKQARYSNENVGHFGLAATDYTHFTSPIRRYPDLLVHRKLAELLSGRKTYRPATKVSRRRYLWPRPVSFYLKGKGWRWMLSGKWLTGSRCGSWQTRWVWFLRVLFQGSPPSECSWSFSIILSAGR